jgi:GTP-binding protein
MKPDLPEFAFIGRSNVGKSSLINMLTGHKKLAKTSSTPGKTRLINHFLINEKWYLVDLPGYGFAKVSKDKRVELQKTIFDYIGKRDSLYYLFVLIDSRIPPLDIDLNFINLLGKHEIAFALVFTKIDKISSNVLAKNIEEYKKTLAENWDEMPVMIASSSLNNTGRDEILKTIFTATNKTLLVK